MRHVETMGAGFVPPFNRRRFLGACAALCAERPANSTAVPRWTLAPADDAAAPDDLDIQEITTGGDARLSRRALVLSPRARHPGERWPVLVLLHGLGETGNERLGLRAWSDRYGLIESDARLRRPPISRRHASPYLTGQRAEALNAEIARRPYRGFVFVCPFTPNVYKIHPTAGALDRFADWLVGTLLPIVHERSPSLRDPASTALDGCSLGGYVALEVFLRKPEAFGALGCVQAGVSANQANLFARKLRATFDRVGPRPLHIETSSWDPSMKDHHAMSTRLTALGVAHDYEVLPGGHDQIFLREVGTLEMLFWHDRRGPVARAKRS
jgi:enterochelin esterase-like enzyme